jgi:hypothetical protein
MGVSAMKYVRVRLCLFSGLCLSLLSGDLLFAQEATTYTYDPLNRLSGSSISGGPNNGVHTATCFDNAGNRTQYQTGSSGLQSCPTPTPASEPAPPTPPTPPPAAPNAAGYSASGPCYAPTTVNVVQNDTDPGGNYPITLLSVLGTNNVNASVVNSTTVQLTGAIPETDTVVYVVGNSAGTTGVGTITYTTTGNPQTCATQ